MNASPKVSIIIPYHRKKKFFFKTIKSILNQSFKNFEIIIIYDDFNRNELDYINNISNKSSKIKLIINQKNLGPGLSRNKGLSLSKGEFIAFCDADDLWNKDKLKIQIKFMESNKLNFSHTSYYVIDKDGKKIGNFRIKKKINYQELLKSCDIGLSTVIVKKKIIKNNNFFCQLKTKEDFNTWLNIVKIEKNLVGLDKPLTSWRFLNDSLSSSTLQKLLDAFRLFYKYEKFSIFMSIFFVLRLSYNAISKKIKIYN
ncbi:MAG: hypothetical protein CBB97_00345 [Candidatus Endolissoclinum sp. TMED37]|nr:MAG: hypothetical protein CBB97_00345 [Candidatus Endolissoclinum sp. TMED37]